MKKLQYMIWSKKKTGLVNIPKIPEFKVNIKPYGLQQPPQNKMELDANYIEGIPGAYMQLLIDVHRASTQTITTIALNALNNYEEDPLGIQYDDVFKLVLRAGAVFSLDGVTKYVTQEDYEAGGEFVITDPPTFNQFDFGQIKGKKTT